MQPTKQRTSMKQILFSLLIICSVAASAQTRLGLKLAPVIASNRATNDAQSVDNDGSNFKLSIGLIVDQPLSDSYYLSSGLVYIPKQAAFRTADNQIREQYTLQYLQIPATLKLFTNEIAPDMKVFFQVGGGIDIKVFDEPDDPDNVAITKFNPLDISVILGSGVEYRAGINTTIFAGISYQRGLANVVKEVQADAAIFPAEYQDIQIRNTVVSIDLGVKF
ncbi:MAG: hypothetical protein Tsb0034_17810 [Ekhidna sp.]